MQNIGRLDYAALQQQQEHFFQESVKSNQVKPESSRLENDVPSFPQTAPKTATTVQPLIVDETKQYMNGLLVEDDEDSEGEVVDKIEKSQAKKSGKKTRGRVKIKMEFIQNKLRRYTTFSKRKTGIMKKAYELSTLTGTQVMLLVASETGHVYTFATRKLQPMITSESGKALIQTCLNSPDPTPVPVLNEPQVQQALHSQPIQAIAQPLAQHIVQNSQAMQTNASAEQQVIETAAYGDNTNLQFQTNEELKIVQNASQAGQSFPITTYITPASQVLQTTKQQQVGSITTIFTPAAVSTSNSTSSVALQQASVQQQPQIISGQLQLHRIHPQNIILTGNGPCIQQNHIILNQGNSSQSSLGVSNTIQQVNARSEANTSSSQQEIIAVVNPHQMVYNSSGNVIYATRQPEAVYKRPVPISSADQLSLQHTPVIQASGERHQMVDGDALIVPRTQNDIK